VDHRRRILEHLEKMEAEKPAPEPAPSDPQLKIPLIGEVRRPPEVSPPNVARGGPLNPDSQGWENPSRSRPAVRQPSDPLTDV
jgi:hypothetical protein